MHWMHCSDGKGSSKPTRYCSIFMVLQHLLSKALLFKHLAVLAGRRQQHRHGQPSRLLLQGAAQLEPVQGAQLWPRHPGHHQLHHCLVVRLSATLPQLPYGNAACQEQNLQELLTTCTGSTVAISSLHNVSSGFMHCATLAYDITCCHEPLPSHECASVALRTCCVGVHLHIRFLWKPGQQH